MKPQGKTIIRTCPHCHKPSEATVSVDGWFKWQKGALIQDAFPNLPKATREILISGTHPECWDAMFPPEACDCGTPRGEGPICEECYGVKEPS